jgi:DNA polymerase III sliding clamp (beta) subunit (PCNA family)
MSPIALPLAELKPALTGLAKVINRHSALPVLNHVRIERAPNGWVTFTATDLDHYVTVRSDLPSPGEPMSLLVPYDALLKISKGRGKDEEIFLTPGDNSSVSIRAAIGDQFAETTVESLPVEEFPPLPTIGGDPIALNTALRSAVQQALECASTDETRLILNRAYLDVSKPKAHYVVGTDGRHLFSSNSFALPLKDSVLIPSHRFLAWKEFHADGEWQLQVAPKEKDSDDPPPFQISGRRWQFISRQIAGNYPNWRQVVPDGNGTQTTIDVDPEAVEVILQIITKMPDHDVLNHGLGLEIVGSQVRLIGCSSKDGDWTRVTLEGVKAKGKEVTIHLNRELLAKALRFGLTRIAIIDPMSPLKFSEGGRQMIIMPVRAEAAPIKPTTPTEPTPAEAHQEEPAAPEPVPAISPEATHPPTAEHPGRKPMPEKPNGNTSAVTPPEKPALETALAQIEIVRGDFRNAIAGLNKLAENLKQAQREQKAGDKEVQSVRQTLRSLQGVRI